MMLIVQLYAPTDLERIVYVFSCNEKCGGSGSWLAFSFATEMDKMEAIAKEENKNISDVTAKLKAMNWGIDGADDWGSENESEETCKNDKNTVAKVQNEVISDILPTNSNISNEIFLHKDIPILPIPAFELVWTVPEPRNLSHEEKLYQEYLRRNVEEQKSSENQSDDDIDEDDSEDENDDPLALCYTEHALVLYDYNKKSTLKPDFCECGAERVFEFQLQIPLSTYINSTILFYIC